MTSLGDRQLDRAMIKCTVMTHGWLVCSGKLQMYVAGSPCSVPHIKFILCFHIVCKFNKSCRLFAILSCFIELGMRHYVVNVRRVNAIHVYSTSSLQRSGNTFWTDLIGAHLFFSTQVHRSWSQHLPVHAPPHVPSSSTHIFSGRNISWNYEGECGTRQTAAHETIKLTFS